MGDGRRIFRDRWPGARGYAVWGAGAGAALGCCLALFEACVIMFVLVKIDWLVVLIRRH